MRMFITRRYQFAKILESSRSAISPSRFIRLIALATVQTAFNLPYVLFVLSTQLIEIKLSPWIDWAHSHYNFDTVETLSTAEQLYAIPLRSRVILSLVYWIHPVVCALFFIFFGLGEESLERYRRWWESVSSVFRGLARNTRQIATLPFHISRFVEVYFDTRLHHSDASVTGKDLRSRTIRRAIQILPIL